MKLTRHNGRAGKNGVYNPKHNDRSFDIANSEHIDLTETSQQNSIGTVTMASALQNPEKENELSATLKMWNSFFYRQRYRFW